MHGQARNWFSAAFCETPACCSPIHKYTAINRSLHRLACHCDLSACEWNGECTHSELLLRRRRRARTLSSQNQSAAWLFAFRRLGVNLIVAQYRWCEMLFVCQLQVSVINLFYGFLASSKKRRRVALRKWRYRNYWLQTPPPPCLISKRRSSSRDLWKCIIHVLLIITVCAISAEFTSRWRAEIAIFTQSENCLRVESDFNRPCVRL